MELITKGGNMSYYGLWYGGVGKYSSDLNESHVEWWPTLREAKNSLLDRYNSGYMIMTRLAADGWEEQWVNFPCVGEDSSLELYKSTDRKPKSESNPYGADPDLRLVLKVNKRGIAYATQVEKY